MSRTGLLSEAASFETESADDNLPILQNLSIEQMLKIGEVQALENLLEMQLQRKHQQELREHVLRQEKEMRDFQRQQNFADESFAFEAGNLTNMSLPSSQPVTPILSALSEVPEMNAMCEEMVGANVPNVPLSPELSPLLVGMCMSDECEGTLGPTEQDLAHQLHEFSLYNEESTSTLPSTMANRDDVLSCQSAVSSMMRQKKVKYPQNEYRKSHFPYVNQPKTRRINSQLLKSGTSNKLKDLFKTAICSKWKELGSCPYGEKCRFAHGLRELRMRPKRHKKFNHVTCKNFLEGCCPYGSRCRFSHDVFEHRMLERHTGVFSRRNLTPDWTGRYGYDYGDYLPRTLEDMDMYRHWGIEERPNVRGHMRSNCENMFIY